MKIQELLEQHKTTTTDVRVPEATKKLDYSGWTVNGFFKCSWSDIESLEGSPDRVNGAFITSNTNIKSLIGAPSYVGGNFLCYSTPITSLEGAPKHIGGYLDCDSTNIISLHNVHKQVGYIGNALHLPSTLVSHVLGVLKIEGLEYIKFEEHLNRRDIDQEHAMVTMIINKYLSRSRNIHACQETLIEAGLKEYARL